MENQTNKPKISKLDHLVITTAKRAECIAFYEKLGFSAKDKGNYVTLFAGDFKINVHTVGNELLPHAETVRSGSADFCMEVQGNLLQIKQNLEEDGIAIELGIVERTGVKGQMQSLYMRDPDGNLVEFCSYQNGIK